MKLKFILFVSAISVPVLAFSQATPFLYNKGVMVVKGTKTTEADVEADVATLYVGGDFVAGTDGTVANDIVLDNSKTVITGNFYHNVVTLPAGQTNANIFRPADATPAALVRFNNSLISFDGTTQQKITTSEATFPNGVPNKATGYINFPNLKVNITGTAIDKNNVWFDWRLSAKANKVNLAQGWLTLASAVNNGKTYLAHFVPQSTDYKRTSTNILLKGATEVELDLGTQQYNVGTDQSIDNKTYGRLIGIGSPFAYTDANRNGLRTDYFAWNFLMEPNYKSYFGDTGNAIASPVKNMPAGKGYILGVDLRGSDFGNYSHDVLFYTTEAQFNSRVSSSASNGLNGKGTTKYIFNRLRYAETSPNAEKVENKNYYAWENLVTADFTVPLDKGYNFLSNPFTAPYDVSDIMEGTSGADIKKDAVWILNSNTSKGSGSLNMFPHAGVAPGNKWLQVAMNFYTLKTVGGTFVDGNDDPVADGFKMIPPLQMFVVYANSATNYTFKQANRKLDDGSNTNFLRSTAAAQNTRKDDFIFEVTDVKTGTNDRTNVVLRPKSEIMSNANYQSIPRWYTGKVNDESSAVNSSIDVPQTYSSQIYTKDDDNNKLTVNFLPYTKAGSDVLYTTMYMIPPADQHEVAIKGYRLNTLSEFEGVFLLDKVANKEIELKPETVYKTTAKPTDRTDRFVLKFTRTTTGIEDEIEETTKNITSYYANGVLTLNGFDDADFGSTINVYDIQGRLAKQAKVDDYTVDIYETFAPGAYIVKVVGNNSYVAKFLVR